MGDVTLEGVDEDATLAGGTEQILAYPTIAAEESSAELAWSAEEEVIDLGSPDRRHWLAWSALVVVLCAVTAASVWLATVFYQQKWATPNTINPEAQPAVVVPAPPPQAATPLPSPGPPAQHEEPPAPKPDPDQQFLAVVAEIPGVTITNPQVLITETKVVCTELRNGAAPGDIIAATMREAPGLSRAAAEDLFDAGTTVYCPDLAHR